jgi:neutral ceramidase
MLTAGASCVDVTPPLGTKMRGYFEERTARTVHDPLHVRSFALENGDGAVALAICDIIGINREYLDQARALIAETTDLQPEQVLIASTHTHTGPHTGDDDYTQWLWRRIADGVRIAWQAREPAEVGWASAKDDRLVFNRRYRMADGSIQTNPGIGNPDVVEPAGPTDPEVGVMVLRRPDCGTIGALGNYALHYVGIPDDHTALSADYFGYFSTMMQRLRDERFVAALSNGASGDINNLNVMGGVSPRNDHYQHCERAGAVVATNALWAWNEADFTDALDLGAAFEKLTLEPRPPVTDEELAKAQEIEERIEEGHSVRMGERSFRRRVRRFEEEPPTARETIVQALRVGDLAIAGVPGEFFVELGLEIKRRSPFAQTMVVELANDSVGYIPTLRAFEEGAYEANSSRYAPGFGEQIVDTAVGLLEDLKG